MAARRMIFGTRPEAIKMAPLVKSLQADVQRKVRVGVTAQRREVPDLVHGGTATTLTASLAAYHQRIPVGHACARILAAPKS